MNMGRKRIRLYARSLFRTLNKGRKWNEDLLTPSCQVLGSLWAALGELLESFQGGRRRLRWPLGCAWALLGRSLGAPWAVPGAPWAVPGAPWALPSGPWAVPGRSRAVLGGFLGVPGQLEGQLGHQVRFSLGFRFPVPAAGARGGPPSGCGHLVFWLILAQNGRFT